MTLLKLLLKWRAVVHNHTPKQFGFIGETVLEMEIRGDVENDQLQTQYLYSPLYYPYSSYCLSLSSH